MNQGVGESHIFSAICTHAGFGASATLTLFALIRKAYLTHEWPIWWQIVVIYAQLISLVGVVLLFTETDVFSGMNIDPAFIANKFEEWMYTFAIIGWFVELALVTPVRTIDSWKIKM